MMETCVGGSGVARGFLELPEQIYANDPLWIPEEPQSIEAAFGPANPWFDRAEAKTFCLPGRARLAVFCDPRARVHGKTAAFFGYWETVTDVEPSRQLFAEARAWAEERGVARLCGPINFSTFGQYRLRTSAPQGAVPFIGEPYNPATYPKLLEALGLTVIERYCSRHFSSRCSEPTAAMWGAARDRARGRGYRFEPLDPVWWVDHLPELHQGIDEIFGANIGYTPLGRVELERVGGEALASKACTRTSCLVFGPDGDLAAFAMVFPHYGPLVVQGAGARRLPVSALRFDDHGPWLDESPVRMSVIKTLGVRPSHRGRNLSHALVAEVVTRAQGHYDGMVAALQRTGSIWDRSAAGLRRALDAPGDVAREEQHESPLGGCREYALYGMELTSRDIDR